MDPSEMIFVPMVLFMIIVAPIWIVMHYRSLNRSSRSLSEDDRQSLDEMLATVDKLVERIGRWSRYWMRIIRTGARRIREAGSDA